MSNRAVVSLTTGLEEDDGPHQGRLSYARTTRWRIFGT